MLDRYVRGDIARISPEALVPVIRLNQKRELLGGAGNTGYNFAALVGRAILVSLAADDNAGNSIRRLVQEIPRI